MLLEKINEHYENIIKEYFEYENIEKTKNGLFISNKNENVLKLHKICKIIPKDLILKHVETIIIFGQYIKMPQNILKIVDSYQDRFKDKYFLGITREYENYRFSFFHKEYEYKIYSFLESHLNEDSISQNIEIFISKEIKLPNYIIDRIIIDVEENFLNGYDINFEKYRKELILASKKDDAENDYMLLFTNIESGKQIFVHPLQINEGTGDVFFAGKYNNILKS